MKHLIGVLFLSVLESRKSNAIRHNNFFSSHHLCFSPLPPFFLYRSCHNLLSFSTLAFSSIYPFPLVLYNLLHFFDSGNYAWHKRDFGFSRILSGSVCFDFRLSSGADGEIEREFYERSLILSAWVIAWQCFKEKTYHCYRFLFKSVN